MMQQNNDDFEGLVLVNQYYNQKMSQYLARAYDLFVNGQNLNLANEIFQDEFERKGFKQLGIFALSAHNLIVMNSTGELSSLCRKNFYGIKVLLPIFYAPFFVWERDASTLTLDLVNQFTANDEHLEAFYIKFLNNIFTLIYNK